jgi:hypothetical protein
MGHPQQGGPPEPQFTTYEGDDSEINHITYSIGVFTVGFCKPVLSYFRTFVNLKFLSEKAKPI